MITHLVMVWAHVLFNILKTRQSRLFWYFLSTEKLSVIVGFSFNATKSLSLTVNQERCHFPWFRNEWLTMLSMRHNCMSILSHCVKQQLWTLCYFVTFDLNFRLTKITFFWKIFKQQEEELSQARDELNKIREEETKLEHEVSFLDSSLIPNNKISYLLFWTQIVCELLNIWTLCSQIEASKEHLETVQKQIKSVQGEISQVSG